MGYSKADVLSYFYRYTSRKVGPDCIIKNEEEYDLYRTYIDIIRRKIKKHNVIKRILYYTLSAVAIILFFVAPVILHSFYELTYTCVVSMAVGGIMIRVLLERPLKTYTIYNLIGDIKFKNYYATVLSKACILVKHYHDVGQNMVKPVIFGEKYSFPEHLMDKLGFDDLHHKELFAYALLADAMIVDRCLSCAHEEWYSLSSNTKFLHQPLETIIEIYYKEV